MIVETILNNLSRFYISYYLWQLNSNFLQKHLEAVIDHLSEKNDLKPEAKVLKNTGM